jgi:hypothetical protein
MVGLSLDLRAYEAAQFHRQTAEMLNLNVPDKLLAIADELIE